MKNHVSGVILYDETIRQSAKDGTPAGEGDRRHRRAAGLRSIKAPSRFPLPPAS